MIDHMIIPNLDRRPERWAYMLGVLDHARFPIRDKNIVMRFSSHDGQDYDGLIEVCDAAIADGFDFFEEVKQRPPGIPERYQYHAAWYWTWASILRKIIEMKNKTVMFMIDDKVPVWNWDWGRFKRLANELKGSEAVDQHGKFRAIQLCPPSNELLSPHKYEWSSMVGKGLTGDKDFALILNAMGAKLLLDIQAEHPTLFDTSRYITYIARREAEDPKRYFEGLWHTLDGLVCQGYYEHPSDLR